MRVVQICYDNNNKLFLYIVSLYRDALLPLNWRLLNSFIIKRSTAFNKPIAHVVLNLSIIIESLLLTPPSVTQTYGNRMLISQDCK